MTMDENGLGVPKQRKLIGRPVAKETMITKTYSFYASDITKMLNRDYQPKHVMRMGIMALDDNPQLIKRIGDTETGVEELKTRIIKLVKSLELMSKDYYAMRDKLTALGIKLDEIEVKNADV